MIFFCSYFDKNYLAKFLVLLKSIESFNFKYKHFILALDKDVEIFFKKNKYDNIHVISLENLEEKYKELKMAKKNRSKIEYYFTLSPFLPKYIFEEFKVYNISYLDSDFYFFKSPQETIERNSDTSITIIKQNSHSKFGLYNVGWIYFNFNFKETINTVDEWSAQCIVSCFDIAINNLYADQKYLDDWPKQMNHIRILYPEYTNLSPWDSNKNIEHNLKNVISFHFHALEIKNNLFVSGFHKYNKNVSKTIIKEIYLPYIKDLLFIENNFNLKTLSIRTKFSLKNFNLLLLLKTTVSYVKKKYYKDIHLIENLTRKNFKQ